MQERHYTQDELLQAVYGLERGDGHLASCPECRVLLDGMLARRAESTDSEKLPDASFFARQRAAVYRRAEQPRGFSVPRLATAGAALATVALSLLLLRTPEQQTPAPVAASDDAKLIAEIYSDAYNSEPRAADPVRALFEEVQAQ
jgi:hypothetical protein